MSGSQHLPITGDNPTFTLHQPLSPQTGFENDQTFKDLIQRHLREISARIKIGRRYTLTNIRLSPNYTYNDLKTTLTDLHSTQAGSYKINVGFGYILKHRDSDDFRYYYCSHNNLLFDEAVQVSSLRDSDAFFQKIVDVDLIASYYLQKPSSRWMFAGLTNMELYTYTSKTKLK